MKLTKEFWNNRYIENQTGWDMGEVSAPIKEYIDQLTNKDANILIPGAGNSYEAEYLFKQRFKNTTIVDFSAQAIENFKKRVNGFPAKQAINMDFFKLEGQYDLIIEQTFFCAIDKSLRDDYAKQTSRLLKQGGKLVGLMFDAPMYDDHPPFGGNKAEYEGYFNPYFQIETMEAAYNSVAARAGEEIWVNMTKR